jgi:hypothetical protein
MHEAVASEVILVITETGKGGTTPNSGSDWSCGSVALLPIFTSHRLTLKPKLVNFVVAADTNVPGSRLKKSNI